MSAANHFHSVALLEEVCVGCTICTKSCPTEAIRVRGGKARIINERCTDCGACIDVCPVKAKIAVTTPLAATGGYAVKVAVILPSLYSQFGDDVTPGMLVQAVKMLGFDEVVEAADSCMEISAATRLYMAELGVRKPQISFNCPAVTNLIRVRYPDLLEHLLPLSSPMALAARDARERIRARGVTDEGIGVFALIGCAARMTRIRAPLTQDRSALNGAISVAEVYGELAGLLKKVDRNVNASTALAGGIRWGTVGGEVKALRMPDSIYVDGLNNVIDIFEEIEKGNLYQFNMVEARVCVGGCVGGPLMVDNVYLARNKIKKLARLAWDKDPPDLEQRVKERYRRGDYAINRRVQPMMIDPLDADPRRALEKIQKRKEVLALLPGIDCGACGAPNCRALAEDVIQGRADPHDCIFLLFKQANKLAYTVYEWTSRLPLSLPMDQRKNKEG